jgi:hypothetical protein
MTLLIVYQQATNKLARAVINASLNATSVRLYIFEIMSHQQASSESESELPVSVQPGADSYQPSLATHAERTNSITQPSRKLKKLSDAQKASQHLRRKVNQEEHMRLIEDFDSLLQRHSQEQDNLAEKYNLKPEYLEKLKGTSKHYKAKREVNIENAKIHMKSIEVNAGM